MKTDFFLKLKKNQGLDSLDKISRFDLRVNLLKHNEINNLQYLYLLKILLPKKRSCLFKIGL